MSNYQMADAFMGIFGMKRIDSDDFTCKSCEYSIGQPEPMTSSLWCQKHDRRAQTPCQDFCYAPGSDEWETDE